jgi:hypothetical protein
LLRELDDRERRDQIRDWGVLATLTREGATPEQIAAATYQMPPARLPYLDELYSFSYGRGRRAYFRDRVLLFVDADDPDRTSTIGRLADQVRMELGEIPRSAEIYVVEDQRNQGQLQVSDPTRVAGARLFSPDYGYVEAEVGDADQLAAWLARIDDLVRFRIEPGKLVLGGRRFAGTRTASVTLDDVAALYQAPGRIRDRKIVAWRKLQELDAAYDEKIAARVHREVESGRAATKEAALAFETAYAAELAPAKAKETAVIDADAPVSSEPGFSLDPLWLPAPDGVHPLMLARLQQLANDPCAEISRLTASAPALLAAEPDESRRSPEAWTASWLLAVEISPATCSWLHDFVGTSLRPVIAELETAVPSQWRHGFIPFEALRKKLQSDQTLSQEQREAKYAVALAIEFYRYETGAQCARYDGIDGTAVGMTLFYTDLLAKLWGSLDFGYSAPLSAIPGFITAPRVNYSAVFQADALKFRQGRLWFAHRADGWSRTTAGPAQELAFVHRFNRLYIEDWDPADRGGLRPPEWTRISSHWWDRHFEDIADHEQQYHRQNQIMKWSVATATMLDMQDAPRFLANVAVDRTAHFVPWYTDHSDELRFHEPLPERRTAYRTECLPLLASYEHAAGGDNYAVLLGGGVSLAGRNVARNAPIVQPKLPPGQRVVTMASTDPGPVRALAGRTVAIKNAEGAATHGSGGPLNLPDVSARFDGNAASRSFTLNSRAGKLVDVTLARTRGGVRIGVEAGPVEKARAALTTRRVGTSISFAGRDERVWLRDGAWLEVEYATGPSADGTVTVAADDVPEVAQYQARAADAASVQRRMDAYAWQEVTPGRTAGSPALVHFLDEGPPVGARELQVRGVQGVTKARVTEDGTLYFPRPPKHQLTGWRGIALRAAEDPAAFRAASSSTRVDLSPRPLRSAEQLARTGRLEEAAPALERHLGAKAKTSADSIRDVLRDLGYGKAGTARSKLDALLRGKPLAAEDRGLLVESMRNHGDLGAARWVELESQGTPAPPGLSLAADRGRVVVRYEARGIELVDVDPAQVDRTDRITYFDSRLLVGREGFEPDFSGPAARWAHDPRITVRELKMQPDQLAPGIQLDVDPEVVVDAATGRELRLVHATTDDLPPSLRGPIYVVQPRDCDKAKGDRDCADGN